MNFTGMSYWLQGNYAADFNPEDYAKDTFMATYQQVSKELKSVLEDQKDLLGTVDEVLLAAALKSYDKPVTGVDLMAVLDRYRALTPSPTPQVRSRSTSTKKKV